MPWQIRCLNAEAPHCHEGLQGLEIREIWHQQPHRQLKRVVPPKFAVVCERPFHWQRGPYVHLPPRHRLEGHPRPLPLGCSLGGGGSESTSGALARGRQAQATRGHEANSEERKQLANLNQTTANEVKSGGGEDCERIESGWGELVKWNGMGIVGWCEWLNPLGASSLHTPAAIHAGTVSR